MKYSHHDHIEALQALVTRMRIQNILNDSLCSQNRNQKRPPPELDKNWHFILKKILGAIVRSNENHSE